MPSVKELESIVLALASTKITKETVGVAELIDRARSYRDKPDPVRVRLDEENKDEEADYTDPYDIASLWWRQRQQRKRSGN